MEADNINIESMDIKLGGKEMATVVPVDNGCQSTCIVS